MKTDIVVAQDCWIAGQLAGIRMLERELTRAFKNPSARAGEELRPRLDELNSWLNLVDCALTARARSTRRSSHHSGQVVTMPIHQAHRPLPAA
jgi:hypothetical protein